MTHEVYVFAPALQHCTHGNDAKKVLQHRMDPAAFFQFSYAAVATQSPNIACSPTGASSFHSI
jgi:hypothetical protein